MSTKHKQVRIMNTEGKRAVVDDKMSRLILTLWRLGVTTLYSCQGDPHFKDQTCWNNRHHRAYVLMKDDDAAMAVVLLLLTDGELFREKKNKSFEIDFNHIRSEGRRICIRFPTDQIKDITRRLEEFAYE